jgi:hypothetical protein
MDVIIVHGQLLAASLSAIQLTVQQAIDLPKV